MISRWPTIAVRSSGMSTSTCRRELITIVGPNGAGKSTLLKAAPGLIPAASGRVRVFGKPMKQQRSQVAYVPQRESVDWHFPSTLSMS